MSFSLVKIVVYLSIYRRPLKVLMLTIMLEDYELLLKERNFFRSGLARGENKQANRILQSISSGRNFCRISLLKLINQDICVGCDDTLKSCDTNDTTCLNFFQRLEKNCSGITSVLKIKIAERRVASDAFDTRIRNVRYRRNDTLRIVVKTFVK